MLGKISLRRADFLRKSPSPMPCLCKISLHSAKIFFFQIPKLDVCLCKISRTATKFSGQIPKLDVCLCKISTRCGNKKKIKIPPELGNVCVPSKQEGNKISTQALCLALCIKKTKSATSWTCSQLKPSFKLVAKFNQARKSHQRIDARVLKCLFVRV